MFRSSSVGQRPTSSVPPGTRSQLQNGAVQRGLGALPSTSKMDASPGGGAFIFASVNTLALLARFVPLPAKIWIAACFSSSFLIFMGL